jgi:heat shock protein HtpX
MANTLKTTLLLGLLSGLLLFIGDLLGGPQGLVIAFGFAIVTNFVSYWFSDKIALAMYRARQVGPEHPLHELTAHLARKAGLPVPKVYVIPDDSPNAFATGRNHAHASVAATEGLMKVLSQDELAGVIAHELAHVKHRDILISSVAATIAAAIMMAARFAFFFGGRDDSRGSPLGGLLMLILAPVAAMLIQMAISRSREFAADAGAAAIIGSPHPLVNALRKIDAIARRVPLDANPATAHMFIIQPFTGRAMASLFSTHPPMDKRIAALLAR